MATPTAKSTVNAPLPAPDWLKLRDGTLREGLTSNVHIVALDGHPQFRLTVVPAGGTFICGIVQLLNGNRLDSGKTWPTPDEAFEGSMNELRAKLGW